MNRLTIADLRAAYSAGRTRPGEVVRRALAAAQSVGRRLNAFISLDAEGILSAAARLESALPSGGRRSPLWGAPIAIKDNILVRGEPARCGSRILEGFVAPYSATAVERLVAAGAIPFGRTNCDEFAMGSSNENSAYGPVRNPLDESRTPGGSSGGSAAAVAAGIVQAALGSDTGGSILLPAAFCGLVGIRPTYGRVSRRGLVAFASSLDQIGPLAHTVSDAALVLSCIAGPDAGDATTADDPGEGIDPGALEGTPPCTIGLPPAWMALSEVTEDVRQGVARAVEALEAAGHRVVPVDLPHSRHGVAAYHVIAGAEASSNLARYDGVRYGRAEPGETVEALHVRTRSRGFGAEVKRRILLGAYVLSAGYYEAYYLRAVRVRGLIRREFLDVLSRCEAILAPVAPSLAFRLGEKLDDPLEMYRSDVFTIPVSLAGCPAVALPLHLPGGSLPAAVQLVGRPFGETALLRLARDLESALGERRREGRG